MQIFLINIHASHTALPHLHQQPTLDSFCKLHLRIPTVHPKVHFPYHSKPSFTSTGQPLLSCSHNANVLHRSSKLPLASKTAGVASSDSDWLTQRHQIRHKRDTVHHALRQKLTSPRTSGRLLKLLARLLLRGHSAPRSQRQHRVLLPCVLGYQTL